MQKICSLAVLSWFLVACGGSGGENKVGLDSGPSLADISGVWNATEEVGQFKDVRYIVFEVDSNEIVKGSFVTYDYDADSFDLGENCYRKFSDEIVDLGYGDFEITKYSINEDDELVVVLDQYLIHAKLSGNELTILDDDETTIYPKSTFDESNFLGSICGEPGSF